MVAALHFIVKFPWYKLWSSSSRNSYQHNNIWSTQEVKLPLFAHRNLATVDDENWPVADGIR